MNSQLSSVSQSIASFLMKPINISNVTWTTASSASLNLYQVSVASALFAQTIWTDKIRGFLNLRGTAVFTVKLNANPFQQGRLLMHLIPCLRDMPSPTNYAAMQNLTLCSKTQHPNVELSTEDSEAIFRIPYITPSDYYDTKLQMFDWGTFYIDVLSPLLTGSGGENSVDISVFLHFEDFELAAPWVPQGPSGTRSKVPVISKNSDKEQQALSSGPLSRALKGTQTVLNVLSDIPAISSISSTASWAVGLASGVAGYFGWSKPLIESPPSKMIIRNASGMVNAAGTSGAAAMHFYENGAVGVLPGFAGTDNDEMSFNFLKKVPAYYAPSNIADTDTVGTTIASYSLGPFSLASGGTVASGGYTYAYKNYAPYGYLSNYFLLYRGSIDMTFKFVKTKFHTGRLLFTYTPYITGIVSVANSAYAFREILDLKTSSEITLSFPWMKNVEYLPVGTPFGTLTVTVLNELRHPETAASSIQMLAYTMGGDDFELQCPGNASNNTAYALPFVPQMDVNAEVGIVNKPIGNSSVLPLEIEPSAFCIGEHFTSVKQLLNRYTRLYNTGNSVTSSYSLWPFSCGICKVSGGSTPENGPIGGDAYSFIAPMYILARGSVRILDVPIYPSNTTNTRMAAAIQNRELTYSSSSIFEFNISSPLLQEGVEASRYYSTFTTTPFTPVQEFAVEGRVIEVNIIPSAKTSSRLIATQSVYTEGTPSDYSQPSSFLEVYTPNATGHVIYRSFGDDLQLGKFIGAPPILTAFYATP